MNSVIRGWANYFRNFCPSMMKNELLKANLTLVRWAMRTQKRLRGRSARAVDWLGSIAKARPNKYRIWASSNKKYSWTLFVKRGKMNEERYIYE
ncbi:group II intron maturase-specific domain-containing protein [Desulfitobacterium hafniense]|uniref:Group II intron maturase-specific domain-containing protein n=1 Tax=Desulfitobacterium hafniense (strain Y51) TaxID=138119 RepID=Q24S93_DESHY|nr:group II intron maturase-specific domain-containing protein [Desulfitobacterium hafniense]BAE85099.1 hypothetical protein DSY3310 [Desulfitobacterium hafniense Y51]